MSKIKNFLNKVFNKNNILIISFFIFVSISIIVGISLGTKRLWYDVISIVAIFYIGCPLLVLIFTLNGNGFFKKTIALFKFKEMKNLKNKTLSSEEEEKLKAFNLEETHLEKKPKNNYDLICISTTLIIYGTLLLLITIPSLIIFALK